MAALEEIGVRVLVVGLGEFRRAMGTARDDIRNTESTIRSLSGASATFGQNMVKVGSALIGVGRTMTLALTAPIAATTGLLINAGMQFEDTFAGISKTVDGIAVGFDEIRDAAQRDLGITVTTMDEAKAAAEKLGMEFGDLTEVGQQVRDEFREMALTVPLPTNELNRLGEVVGQLGVGAEDIADVTKLVAELGVATDMAAEDAAFGLLKFFNIVGEEGDDVVDFIQRAGSAIVALGNNSAATESEILGFSLRLAAAGERANFSEQEILAWATTLADVGARAEAGGTAVSRAMNEMFIAIETGSDSLGTFAAVSKQSAADFAKAFEKDASGAFQKFLGDLKEGIETGRVTKEMLTDMGLGGVRALDIISRLGEAQDRFTQNLETANKAWAEGIALQEEAEKRFNTVASQVQLLKNSFTDLGITIFDLVKDDIKNLIENIRNTINFFKNLDPAIQKSILSFLGFLAVLGPILIALGGLISIVGTAITTISALISPIGLAAVAIGALILTAGALMDWGAVWDALLLKVQNLAAAIEEVFKVELPGFATGEEETPKDTFARKNEGVDTTIVDPDTKKKLQELKTFFDGFLSFGSSILQMIGDIFSAFAKGFQEGFQPFLDSLGPKLDTFMVKLGELGVALGPLGDAIMDLFKAFGVEGNWESFGEFLGELSGDLLGLVVDRLTELVGTLGEAARQFVGLKELLEIMIPAIGEKITLIGDDIRNFFTNLGNNIGPFFGRMGEDIGLFFTTLGENISLFFGPILENIRLFFENLGVNIQTFFTNFGTFVSTAITDIGTFLTNLGTNISAWFTQAVADVNTFISGVIAGAIEAFNNAKATAQEVTDAISAAWARVKYTISVKISEIKGLLAGFGEDLETAKGDAERILAAVGGAFTTMKNKALAALGAVIDKLNALIQAAADAYAAVTGSPELKLQHPFEDFSKFLKKNDFGALAAESLAMPSILTDVTALQSPQQVAGSSTTDNSISIGDINNVPIPNEDVLLDVLVRRIRAGGSIT